MAVTDADLFLIELQQQGLDERALRLVREVLQSFRGSRLYLANRHSRTPDRRVQTAQKLLQQGFSRNEVRDALMARYAISLATTYRILWRAHHGTTDPA